MSTLTHFNSMSYRYSSIYYKSKIRLETIPDLYMGLLKMSARVVIYSNSRFAVVFISIVVVLF